MANNLSFRIRDPSGQQFWDTHFGQASKVSSHVLIEKLVENVCSLATTISSDFRTDRKLWDKVFEMFVDIEDGNISKDAFDLFLQRFGPLHVFPEKVMYVTLHYFFFLLLVDHFFFVVV